MLEEVFERVPVLGEDQQLAAPIAELGELRPIEAIPKRGQLCLLAASDRPVGLDYQLLEARDLCTRIPIERLGNDDTLGRRILGLLVGIVRSTARCRPGR